MINLNLVDVMLIITGVVILALIVAPNLLVVAGG